MNPLNKDKHDLYILQTIIRKKTMKNSSDSDGSEEFFDAEDSTLSKLVRFYYNKCCGFYNLFFVCLYYFN